MLSLFQFEITEKPLIESISYFGWTYETGADPISFDLVDRYPVLLQTYFEEALPSVGDVLQFPLYSANNKHSVAVVLDTSECEYSV